MFRRCGYRGPRHEDFEKTAKKRKKLAPSPLPDPRPRALTIPLAEETSQKAAWWNQSSLKRTWFTLKRRSQANLDQSSSLLISKLPWEIRQQIFKEVVGGHWLHVVRTLHKLLAIKCVEEPGEDQDTSEHACWGMDYKDTLFPTPDFYRGPSPASTAAPANLLPLLLTCRLV